MSETPHDQQEGPGRLRERLKARRIELKELQRGWEQKPGGTDRKRLNGLYALRCDILAEGMDEALRFLEEEYPSPAPKPL